uniref:Uncharacterized protein n=1 Tax=viral metagenome TaxID=1070528 RepID=A0A6H1ZQA5_9ZZZZ
MKTTAKHFESKTPPWVDLERWRGWILSRGISIIEGERHNQTDGEVHYLLKFGSASYDFHANYWDWRCGWQNSIDWVERIAQK